MSNIYVPIDYSELKSIIPPGEDIIYSTFAHASVESFGSRLKFTSHILLTPNFLFYSQPIKKRKPPELKSIPLYNVRYFASGMIMVTRLWTFRFKIDPKYETKAKFKERKKKFPYDFTPYLIKSKENRVKEMEANPEEFKEKHIRKMNSQIITVNDMYKRIKKKFEK